MPAGRTGVQSCKHYGAASAAGSNTSNTSVRVAPANPNRTFLLIQLTGAAAGLLRFGDTVKGDGYDIPFAVGGPPLIFDQGDTCPTEAINLGAAAATTWAIVEGTTP